jgi:hypothetical protein
VALSCHLLSYFGGLFPSQIGVATVDDYKLSKLREREHLEALRTAHPDKRVDSGLSNGSVNKTLKVPAMILEDAIEADYVETNVSPDLRRPALSLFT